MIWTLAGRSPSLVPVLSSPVACCNGGPGVLLFGPLPSSGAALAVSVFGFGGRLVRAVRRRFWDGVVVAACFGVVRVFGASTWTGGRLLELSCAFAVPNESTGNAAASNPV